MCALQSQGTASKLCWSKLIPLKGPEYNTSLLCELLISLHSSQTSFEQPYYICLLAGVSAHLCRHPLHCLFPRAYATGSGPKQSELQLFKILVYLFVEVRRTTCKSVRPLSTMWALWMQTRLLGLLASTLNAGTIHPAQALSLSTWAPQYTPAIRTLRGDHKFKANVGFIVRLC